MRGSRNFLQGGGVQTETFFSPQLILQRVGGGGHGMEMYRTPVKQKSAVATMIHGCIRASSWCLLMVVCLFLAVPWFCLLYVIVVFPDHAHILILSSEYPFNLLYMNHKTGNLETWFESLDSK